MKYIQKILTYKWYLLIALVIAGGSYYYFVVKAKSTAAVATYYVIDTVSKGDVSSGIRTTGKIIAEQKLDLDIYKQLSRITAVNAINGAHVDAGTTLVSFDKSDVLVTAQSAKVALSDAQLALQTQQANAADPNTQVRTLQSQIAGYQTSIKNAQQSITDAYTSFLNTNLEVVPDISDRIALSGATAPTLSGTYVGTQEGTYTIDIYASAAPSGFSFKLRGLETNTGTVYFGKAVPLGTYGLKITFPSSIHGGDTWVVSVPNMSIASYADTKQAYEQKVANLQVDIEGYEVNLKNAEQNLQDVLATDTSSYRDLTVEKAALAVDSEQQKLAQTYDVLKERSIVAPFAGTIQDMANVVVGATPTGGTSDTISLGTLISDTFLTTFTLSASDVSKVQVGQKVKVTVTSFAKQPVFEATISEISSLPTADGVAQYTVKAKLNYDRTKDPVVLREGVLADIEVVQEEKTDALRIPISAITYESGKPVVKVVDQLTDAQKEEIQTKGAVKLASGVTLPSYSVPIELGIQGSYYVEVTKGLQEGAYIVTTQTTPVATASVVGQSGPRPGGGSARTSSGSSQTGTQSTRSAD